MTTTLDNYLENIGSVRIPRLKSGFDETIESFYEHCIKPNLPQPDAVRGWHELLIRYSNDPEAIFFLRRNASAPKNNWFAIRRGFLTEYQDGSGYVFCDNFFAQYFYVMAYDSFIPSYEEFKASILSRRFPYGSARTQEEMPLQAYPKGKPARINSSGWKLAHLYSVNGNDYSFDYRRIIERLFPRGERSEWSRGENGYVRRYIDRAMSDLERNVLRSHFLRLTDPMNYFLVPMQKYESDAVGCNIGEDRDLLKFVFNEFSNLYSTDFSTYRSAICDGSSYDASDSDHRLKKISIAYGLDIAPKASAPLKESRTNTAKRKRVNATVSEDQLHEMARLYLEQGLSFRKLEQQVLHLDSPARGGGFVAKTALNNFGLTNKNKGALRQASLNSEYTRSSGPYRKALEILYPSKIKI